MYVHVPKDILNGDVKNWGYIVAVMGDDPDAPPSDWRVRKVEPLESPSNFGGAKEGITCPGIIDVLSKPKEQGKILGRYKRRQAVEIPALRK